MNLSLRPGPSCFVLIPLALCLLASASAPASDTAGKDALRAALAQNPDDVDTRLELAKILDEEGDYEGAADLLEEGLAATPDHEPMMRALALVYTHVAQDSEEPRVFLSAQLLWQRLLERGYDDVEVYWYLGITQRDCGQLRKAVASYTEALEIEPDNPLLKLGLAATRRKQGKYELALALLVDAAEAAPGNYEVWDHLGDVQRLLGDYSSAADSMAKASELAPEHARAEVGERLDFTRLLLLEGQSWEAWRSHRGMADRHEKRGRVDRATAEREAALRVMPPGSPHHAAHTHWKIASFLSEVQHYEESIEHCLKSIEAYEEAGQYKGQSFTYQVLANAYTSLARKDKGRRDELLKKALEAREGEEASARKAMDFHMSAHAAIDLARAMEAVYGLDDERTIESRKRLVGLMGEGPQVENCLQHAATGAEAYFRLKEEDYEGSKEQYLRLAPYLRKSKDLGEVIQAADVHCALAHIALDTDEYDEALRLGRESVKILRRARSELGTDAFRRKAGQGVWRSVYSANLIPAALAKSDAQATFEFAEQYKARALLDLLGTRAVDSRKTALVNKRQTERTAEARVRRLEDEVAQAREGSSQVNVRSLQRDLAIERTRYRRLAEDVSVAEKEIASFENASTIDLPAVQALARASDCAFVTYVVGDWGTAITVVNAGDVHAVGVEEATDSALWEAVSACLPGLGVESPGSLGSTGSLGTEQAVRDLALESDSDATPLPEDLSAEEAAQSHLEQLYAWLIEPILPWLDTGLVYISPDAGLNRIPFEALRKDGRYLVEQFTIAYTPSASILKLCLDKERHEHDTALALGNPNLRNPAFRLVHAENEVNALQGMVSSARILTFDAATETAVKEQGHEYDILHLACHGELDLDEPMLTSLRLAPDDANDGYLHAGELFDLDLSASLVVLSACNSGLGELTSGNELMGLTRGFLAAGTPSLIASLWTVDDRSTSFLMQEFYRNLDTMTKAEALRQAKLATMKEFSDPFHWAPFILIGDGR